MAKMSSPSSSQVTITVSSSANTIGLTSPIRRFSLSKDQNSPRRSSSGGKGYLTSSEDHVAYTVHIPPTPDRYVSDSQTSIVETRASSMLGASHIKDTIYTGGYNSVTRAHVVENNPTPEKERFGVMCEMKGCDEKAQDKKWKGQCECGFKICRDCYLEIINVSGFCPGCKDSYKDDCDEEADEITEMGLKGKGGVRMEKNFSLVQSFKAPNQEFDHSKWLFETKGTYGYGNAVWPKNGGFENYEYPAEFNGRRNRPLTRKVGISAAIISPYRLLIFLRLAALACFLTWRISHPNHEAMWLWIMSVICEVWFALSWVLDQLPKLCPVNRITDLSVLKERFEPSINLRNPKGLSDLPGIDVFVSTADPEKEPPLVTANTILSILAVDYPVEKVACYLSDDGGSLITFEALAEAASFAKYWVPFCRKHKIEPRNPEAYFGLKRDPLKNKVRVDFVRERRRVKREYDEFKVRINALPESIRRRSDACNAQAELRARKTDMEMGGNGFDAVKVQRATYMSDSPPSHWPGTWFSPEEGHSRGNHEGIIQIMLVPPNPEPVFGSGSESTDDLIDTTDTDTRLPMLVYVSREKRPGFDHNKKAGAMNALVRTSAIMSNGSFILNLDCDHYIYNSLAIREGMCFMLDRGGDKICYVQFPQRFEGIDPNDRYANHNTVFFDVSMRALDGLQGPMYVGTGCIFRRIALYGFSPPRATEHLGWFGNKKIKFLLRKRKMAKHIDDDEMIIPMKEDPEEDEFTKALIPQRFGNSTALIDSIMVAEFGGRPLHDLRGKYSQGRPSGSLAVQREPLDASALAEAISVVTCFYEDKTEWGKRVGWIYGSITEDVVTGYRMHNRGWRSIYCVTKPDAFRGTAPINLTDRLNQVLRWATGSVEIFFSRNNALFATRRMKFLQRVAYFNTGMYPFTSIFLLAYCFLPAFSLFSGKFIVQSLNATFLVFLLAITLTLSMLAILEIKWSKITLHDWWRNEQFWLIGGTSAHLAAVFQGILKVIAGVDISFTLTSKSNGQDDGDDEFAELYEFRFTFLMLPPITIILVNMTAIAVGTFRTLYSPFPQWSKLLGGVFFSFWVLAHLYPFAKGLMGRRGRIPTIVYLWSMLLCIIISLLAVYMYPPGGRQDYMNLTFP